MPSVWCHGHARVAKKSQRKVFGCFRPLGAFAGPGGRQKPTRGENQPWGKGRDFWGPRIKKRTSDV
eukprot:5717312-Pyramimonas_sp.AAC.1